MTKKNISETEGLAATKLAARAAPLSIGLAVRFLLQTLATRYPGQALEVRVSPYGAVQCGPGPLHKRGLPGSVVECSPEVFLDLALGRQDFFQAQKQGWLLASGAHADLSAILPLVDADSFELVGKWEGERAR